MQCLDYSDDEAEKRAKAKLRMRGVVKEDDSGNVEDDDDDSSSNDRDTSPQKTQKFRRRKQYVISSLLCYNIRVTFAGKLVYV